MKKLLLIVLGNLLLMGNQALAYGVGNGGDAVVCYTDATRSTITSVESFDYWEQENILHYPGGINLGGTTVSVQDKIEIAMNRLAYYNEDLVNKIKPIALSIANNINSFLVTSYQLPEINDANPKALPSNPNCFVEQFAVQWQELASGQRRFAIAEKFYNFPGASNNTKVGIILHEAIYRYALNNGAINSDGARYFNYNIASSFLENKLPQSFVDLLNGSNLNQMGCAVKYNSILNLNIVSTANTNLLCSAVYINKPQFKFSIYSNGQAYIKNEKSKFEDPLIIGEDNRAIEAIKISKAKIKVEKIINGNWVSLILDEVNILFSENKLVFIENYNYPISSINSEVVKIFPKDNPNGFQCQTNITIYNYNQITSCSLDTTLYGLFPAKSLIYKNQLINVSDFIKIYPNLNINTIWLYGYNPISFKARGTQNTFINIDQPHLLILNRVSLDQNGDLTKADSIVPIQVNIDGAIEVINQIEYIDQFGQIDLPVTRKKTPNFSGLKILAKENINYDIEASNMCAIYSNIYTAGSLGNILNTYSTDETFYDLVTAQPITIYDSSVNYFSDLTCSGRTLIQL